MSASPSIADAARELQEEFALFDDWRDKVEYIIDLGKNLPALPESLKTEGNKVRGCQSQVWMVAEPQAGGRLHLRADSDAILVKGLVSLLLHLYDNRTPQEILANPPIAAEDVEQLQMRGMARSNPVVLPAPVGPTMATVCPALASKDTAFNTGLAGS